MSCSIAIRVSDKERRKQLISFMEANFRPWNVVCGSKDVCDVEGISHGRGGLAYDRNPHDVGFNYHCYQGVERQYIHCVINWMARNFGELHHFDELGKYLPFCVYDGKDLWPCATEAECEGKGENRGCGFIEDDGWFPWDWEKRKTFGSRMAARLLGINPAKHKKLIRDELARLTQQKNIWFPGVVLKHNEGIV